MGAQRNNSRVKKQKNKKKFLMRFPTNLYIENCYIQASKDSIIKILLSFFSSNTIKYIGFIRNKSK